MGVRLKKIANQVMVITGASSGIGLVTARMAAKKGARLVLVARNQEALHQLAEEINRNGGQAIYVVADVGNEEEVRAVGRIAAEHFGSFDTWVNDAGIGIFGALLDVPTADSHRLFETNFWGVVYGSLEAARRLKERKDSYGAAIINVGSEASDRAAPLLGMYSASKHAVKGFTDALRMELEKADAPISVTLVKPAAIDTPFPQHAKNLMAQEPDLPAPIYSPEVVAEVILHCAENPVRDMFAGGSAQMHSAEAGVVPRLMDWMMEALFFDKLKSKRPARHAAEALDAPTTGLRERSGTRNDVKESSMGSEVSMHPMLAAGIFLGAGLAVAGLVSVAAASRNRGY